jgi:ribosomal protein S18 acetylase RimI-like enzyme
MDVVVRPARADDWTAVATLLAELGRGVAKGTAIDPTHRMQFAGHLRRLEIVSLVAEGGRGIVGALDMEYHQRLGDHRPQARVNDLVVADAARRSGVGHLLLARTGARDGPNMAAGSSSRSPRTSRRRASLATAREASARCRA